MRIKQQELTKVPSVSDKISLTWPIKSFVPPKSSPSLDPNDRSNCPSNFTRAGPSIYKPLGEKGKFVERKQVHI